MIEETKRFAINCHIAINQMYHNKSYAFHLQMVVETAMKHIDLIPEEDIETVLCGCWVHDVIEDTGKIYNDVKRATNIDIAEYAYALTTEKGRTRKDRANQKYYEGIRHYKHATFIKLCDRYANAKYSKDTGSSMFKQYKKEMKDFKAYLYDGRYQELWDELEKLFE